MKRILVSASEQDMEFTTRLVKGIYDRVLIDLEIFHIEDPGLDLAPAREIQRAFQVADVTLLVLSPDYLSSQRGRMFIESGDTYFAERGWAQLILVVAQRLDRPFALQRAQQVDLTAEHYDAGLRELVRTLSIPLARDLAELFTIPPRDARTRWIVFPRPVDPTDGLMRALGLASGAAAIGFLIAPLLFSLFDQAFPALLLSASPWLLGAAAAFFLVGALYARPRMPTFTFTTFPNVPQKSIIPLVAAIGGLLLSQTKVVETLAYPYANEVHTVFYATDRAAAAAGDTAMFTRDTSNGGNISYGSAVAHLPWKRETNVRLILWRPSSALQRPFITDQKSMTADEFKQAITLVTRASERDSAFLFVHGFRVPFVDALTTAGQLARDLKFDGAPILFSWPAGDAVTEYIHDYDNANWAADHLERLLTTIVTDVQPKRFHLIAHSMGTRVMALALDKLKDRQPDSEHRFENIIFAAADLDPLMFDQTMPAVTHFGRRTTLYICDCDWALFASTKAHFGPRVGMVRNSYPSIDVIDAGTIDHAVLELNHSYLVESETMLTDLFVMINFNRSPAGRPSMAIDGCCWVFMKRGVN